MFPYKWNYFSWLLSYRGIWNTSKNNAGKPVEISLSLFFVLKYVLAVIIEVYFYHFKLNLLLFDWLNVCQICIFFMYNSCSTWLNIPDIFGVCIVNTNFNWTSLTNWKTQCYIVSYCEISVVVLLDSVIQISDIVGCETAYHLCPKLWFSPTM